MEKILLKSLVLISLLFGSCINKDYDFNDLDNRTTLKDMTLCFPFGTIRYNVAEITEKANFNHETKIEGDTIFLCYHTTLDFLSSPGVNNIGIQPLNLFHDMAPEGSRIYFSNPIFDCKVENRGNIPITFNINFILGTKENYDSIAADFGNESYAISVPANKTIIHRFNRVNGETHRIFRIGDFESGIGPDVMIYGFSHTGQNNDDIHAEMTVKLPLAFDYGSKIVFNDTLSLNMSSYDEKYEEGEGYGDHIETVILRLNYINKMPVGGVSEFVFFDRHGLPIAGINDRILRFNRASLKNIQMPGFESNIATQEESGVMYIHFEKSEWGAAKGIRAMMVRTTLANTDKNIHFLPEDFLQLKLDFYLKGNINL